jgi:hypothetical protein
MRIKNKAQMFALYRAGAFGNSPRVWTPEEYFTTDCRTIPSSDLALRYQGSVPGAPCLYNLNAWDIEPEINELAKLGWNPNKWWVSEGIDETHRILQGEVCRSENHLELTYTTVSDKMRIAMAKEQLYAQGLSAVMLLRHALCPNSWNDLTEILDRFDGAVIEFTANAVDTGPLPHRNTVIWEVRNY